MIVCRETPVSWASWACVSPDALRTCLRSEVCTSTSLLHVNDSLHRSKASLTYKCQRSLTSPRWGRSFARRAGWLFARIAVAATHRGGRTVAVEPQNCCGAELHGGDESRVRAHCGIDAKTPRCNRAFCD